MPLRLFLPPTILLPSILLTLVLSGCGSPKGDMPGPSETIPSSSAFFLEADVGVDFLHENGRSGELNLAEITCGAGALLDIDNDGDLDLYFLQGHSLASDADPADFPQDRLYRNDLIVHPDGRRELRFTDVSEYIGVDTSGYGCGVATGDVDGDGRTDLFLGRLGRNLLLRNTGSSGSYFEAGNSAFPQAEGLSSVAPVFLDYDADGHLDLFVGNNVRFDSSVVCKSLSGARDYCGPGAFAAQPDRLYRGRGDGTFEDVTVATGLATTPARPTLGAVAGDFDGDGRLDLYVANDGEPNHLWLQTTPGRFVEEALLLGAAVNASGEAEASMGVATADYDNDGDQDLFLAHLVKESNTLYRSELSERGAAGFTDVSAASGVAASSLSFTAFGTGFLDLDNDGLLDLFLANGAVTLLPELVAQGDPFPLHQTNQWLRNTGGTFVDVTDDTTRSEVSRGAAFGDLDNDGDTDVVVINNGGPARILLNRRGQENTWIGLRVPVGSRVTLRRPDGTSLLRRAATDGSYGAASDPRVLFGLGEDPRIESITVVLPDGSSTTYEDLEPDRYHDLLSSASEAAHQELLSDQSEKYGLRFTHQSGVNGAYGMEELMGAGVALFDADGDEDLDVYFVQGIGKDRLLRNDGAAGFIDVTTESGLAKETEELSTNQGMGVAVGDADGDGRLDLYVTRLREDRLLLNRSTADRLHFVSRRIDPEEHWTVPALFWDFDLDGRLDLFAGAYLEEFETARVCRSPDGRRDYCGAALFPGVRDRLLRNLGPGDDGFPRWEDVSHLLPVKVPERALGAALLDLEDESTGSRYEALFVANDAGPNHLWRWSQQLGLFEDIALLGGVAVNGRGQNEASMGIAVGDPDRDGDFDLLVTHLIVETNTFYRQSFPGVFEDASAATGLGPPSRPHTAFGTGFFDADGDGALDLFVANGAVQSRAELAAAGDPFPFHEKDQLFLQEDGRFVDASPLAGSALELSAVSRGVAFGDLDNDGDRDLVVTQNGGPARLLINHADPPRWIGLDTAVGTTARLHLADGSMRTRRAARDGSYASSSDPRILFTVAPEDEIVRLEITLPDGETLPEVPYVENRYSPLT